MALIRCSECGTEISDRAATCPKCGAPVATTAAAQPAVTPTPRKTSPATWGCLVFLILAGIGAYISSEMAEPQPTAASASSVPRDEKALEKLNELVRKQMGRNLYTSYRVEGTAAIIQLNPALWNRLSTSEQRQLCDIVGRGTFMEAMGLTIARLRVNETTVGRVVRVSGSQSFEPELQSLR